MFPLWALASAEKIKEDVVSESFLDLFFISAFEEDWFSDVFFSRGYLNQASPRS